MRIYFVSICISAFLFVSQFSRADEFKTDSVAYGIFGKVKIYFPESGIRGFVLFVSGDGGWDTYTENMSRHLVKEGSMVVGLNFKHILHNSANSKSTCNYIAGNLEDLSLTIQKKYKLKQYFKPVLVGYSAGASLIYAALVQAPSNTFKGAIALSFSPDIESSKPFCKGAGLINVAIPGKSEFRMEPVKQVSAPFIVLQGVNDKVCPHKTAVDFIDRIKNAELITLPNVGHGFSVHPNWSPQFVTALNKILNQPTFIEQNEAKNEQLQQLKFVPFAGNLPLTLIPAKVNNDKALAFIISGDGGWTSFDQSLADEFSRKGNPVVGLDAQKYFWEAKTPEQTAKDINQALAYYLAQFGKTSFFIVGYSFGADIVPFIGNRVNASIKEGYKGLFMLSPDTRGDFEIHIGDMLELGISANNYDIIAEIKKENSVKPICFFGYNEDAEDKIPFLRAGVKVIELPGSHHYNEDYALLAETISENLK